jgi:hypothetical protein
MATWNGLHYARFRRQRNPSFGYINFERESPGTGRSRPSGIEMTTTPMADPLSFIGLFIRVYHLLSENKVLISCAFRGRRKMAISSRRPT